MRPGTDADRGLGTAYERWKFYRMLDDWTMRYAPSSFLEGPVDGMAGVAGVFGVGLARRGVKVVSASYDPEESEVARRVYEGVAPAGSFTTRVVRSPEELEPADVVLSYHALSSVDDWRGYLAKMAKLARKALIVTVCNPENWGVPIVRALGRLRGVALNVPESWATETLAPELWKLGRVREHTYFDCPWWPDLQVAPGQSLLDRARGMLAGRKDQLTMTSGSGELAKKFVYGPGRWPYLGGADFDAELGPAIRRHPNFDGTSLGRRTGHLHAFLVDVAPRTPQAKRRLELAEG